MEKLESLEEFLKKETKSEKNYFQKIFKFFLYLFLVIFVSFSFFLSTTISPSYGLITLYDSKGIVNLFQGVKFLLTTKENYLKGEKEDRINFLILGMGGEGWEGPYLTDTIIFASFKPSIKEFALLSIPRDLYVPIPGYGWRKINNAYSFGKIKEKGGELASQVVSHILNLPIHYFIVVDFEGFKKIIDTLGGIDVYVERSFVDHQYPAPGHRYQTVSFSQGWQRMDGERALKFVRSRYGNNEEGSDFARMKRQQKVLIALKEKIFSFSTLVQFPRLIKALNEFQKHLDTNLETWEILRLAKLLRKVKLEEVILKTLEVSPKGPLFVDQTPDGAFILRPKNWDFKEVSDLAKNIFSPEYPSKSK